MSDDAGDRRAQQYALEVEDRADQAILDRFREACPRQSAKARNEFWLKCVAQYGRADARMRLQIALDHEWFDAWGMVKDG